MCWVTEHSKQDFQDLEKGIERTREDYSKKVHLMDER
jgi:hypothetical protein